MVGQFGGLERARPSRDPRAAPARRQRDRRSTSPIRRPGAAANRFAADVYLGFEADADAARRRCPTIAVPEFESAGGRSLAGSSSTALGRDRCARRPSTVAGMRLPVLRETRMPAVLCSLGPVQRVADRAGVIGDAVVAALAAWAAAARELDVRPATAEAA